MDPLAVQHLDNCLCIIHFVFCTILTCLSNNVVFTFPCHWVNKSIINQIDQLHYKLHIPNISVYILNKQYTLRGMAEQRFSNVYFYQCLTLVLYLFHGMFGLRVEDCLLGRIKLRAKSTIHFVSCSWSPKWIDNTRV